MLSEFLNAVYWNNTGEEYLIALGVFLTLFIIFKFFDYFVIHRIEKLAKKSKIGWDDLVVNFFKGINWFFYFAIALYFGARNLNVSERIDIIFYYLIVILIGFYIVKGVSRAIDYFVAVQIKKRKEKDIGNISMMRVFGLIGKLIIWVFAILMILSNFGVEITPLIAGLGVGGIAIALALQNVLSDLFSAFAIYFDKPFKEGDFIIVGSDMGIVKNIGIKTTRIETLQGQELVIANSEMTSTRINNYKRMEKRRIQFSFGVEYKTGTKKLEKIKEIVKTIFDKVEGADLDRVNFKEFGDFSLNYEVVYYVSTSDYNKYMDIQEEINLALYKAFEKEKIGFAFPTQTIYFKK
ncbi:MAG: mechanosensitive ion channel family protein [Nanoarchaeota archaeon]|jgi:small-conductance mechanosensitive channel|nr:mechanosensitive ion channel family protein [Nanoarchaeota archaeon]